MEKTTPEQLRMIADAISARNEALSERDAAKAQVQRLTNELAFVRNEAEGFNTTFSFALERVEAERDEARRLVATEAALGAEMMRHRDDWRAAHNAIAKDRVDVIRERDAYRAILAGIHGALMDAESIQVPDMGEPLDKAVRALVAERDALQAWKGLSAAAYSLRTEQMQTAVARAEQAEAALDEIENIVIAGDDPAALREAIDKSRLPIVAQSSVLLQPAPLDAPDAPVKPDATIRGLK
jgi:uncharacterized protein YukE